MKADQFVVRFIRVDNSSDIKEGGLLYQLKQ